MFSEKLLEAKGFENHYLVSRMGEFVVASLKGRVPAISKKRVGMIDIPLRNFKTIVENVQSVDDFDDTAFAGIDWDVVGYMSKTNEKYTAGFYLESTYENIRHNESPSSDGKVVVGLNEMEFFHNPHFYDVNKEIGDEKWYDEWKQHPLFCLFEAIHLEILKGDEIIYNGLNVNGEGNRGNALYHYSRIVGDKTEYMSLICDLERIGDELEERGI